MDKIKGVITGDIIAFLLRLLFAHVISDFVVTILNL